MMFKILIELQIIKQLKPLRYLVRRPIPSFPPYNSFHTMCFDPPTKLSLIEYGVSLIKKITIFKVM